MAPDQITRVRKTTLGLCRPAVARSAPRERRKGCKTGVRSDPNNIARAISTALPSVPVTGQNQNLKYIPGTDVTVPIPLYNTTTTYLNGKGQ